jgi:hypothetical protein
MHRWNNNEKEFRQIWFLVGVMHEIIRLAIDHHQQERWPVAC